MLDPENNQASSKQHIQKLRGYFFYITVYSVHQERGESEREKERERETERDTERDRQSINLYHYAKDQFVA